MKEGSTETMWQPSRRSSILSVDVKELLNQKDMVNHIH